MELSSVGCKLLPSPPLNFLDASRAFRSGGNISDWKSFKNAGLLDRTDTDVLECTAENDTTTTLKAELLDYQHNLGLILIETQRRVLQIEELDNALAEVQETLADEKLSHVAALSEIEKRENILKYALDVERTCIADLHKALCDVHEEQAQMKQAFHSRMVSLQSSLFALENRSLEMEERVQTLSSRVAEAERRIGNKLP